MLYKKSYISAGVVLLLVAAFSVEVIAKQEIMEEVFDVQPAGTLVIKTPKGSVVVESWDKNTLHVRVKKDARDEEKLKEFEVNIEQNSNGVTIEGDSGRNSRVSVEFHVSVPKHYNVDVDTGGGSIKIGDLIGKVRANTSGGSIRVGDVDGDVRVNTSGGSVSLGKVTGKASMATSGGSIEIASAGVSVKANTSGGSINVGPVAGDVTANTSGGGIKVAHAKGNIKADTSGGSIYIAGSDGDVSVDTSGGSIKIENTSGAVSAHTSGGGIEIRGSKGSIKADTAGGNIRAELVTAKQAGKTDVSLNTAGGSITLLLPEHIKANFLAQLKRSRHGKDAQIYSDFPLKIQNNEGLLVAKGEANGGGSDILLRTVDGDIHIKKSP